MHYDFHCSAPLGLTAGAFTLEARSRQPQGVIHAYSDL